jgi:ankyrin repeat protein
MPLHLAIEEGFVDMAAYLLHWGASKDAVDGLRKTPLMHAQLRLKTKKKTHAANEKLLKCAARALRAGVTPRKALHCACAHKRTHACRCGACCAR